MTQEKQQNCSLGLMKCSGDASSDSSTRSKQGIVFTCILKNDAAGKRKTLIKITQVTK